MSQYERTLLYRHVELIKKITYQEFVEQFLPPNYIGCVWLRDDYDYIRYHDYKETSPDQHFIMPCVNSVHDVFDMSSATAFEYSANQRFVSTIHDNYPGDNILKGFFVCPTKKTIEAFQRNCGSFDPLGTWSGATSFEVIHDVSNSTHNIMVRYHGGRAFLAKVYDYVKESKKYESIQIQQVKTQDDNKHDV